VSSLAVFFLHGAMTRDALWFDVPENDLERLAKVVQKVDRILTHPRHACHRSSKYQMEFEKWGGARCGFSGAEGQAAKFLSRAREYHLSGDKKAAQEELGSAIHFIQDALCPEHIFPFRENPFLGIREPHLSLSLYVGLEYCFCREWQEVVQYAPVVQVVSPNDLRNKIIEAADWVCQLPCSYLRQDGKMVEDPRVGKVSFCNWRMSDGDIERILEKIAGLVKGAVIWYKSR